MCILATIATSKNLLTILTGSHELQCACLNQIHKSNMVGRARTQDTARKARCVNTRASEWQGGNNWGDRGAPTGPHACSECEKYRRPCIQVHPDKDRNKRWTAFPLPAHARVGVSEDKVEYYIKKALN